MSAIEKAIKGRSDTTFIGEGGIGKGQKVLLEALRYGSLYQ